MNDEKSFGRFHQLWTYPVCQYLCVGYIFVVFKSLALPQLALNASLRQNFTSIFPALNYVQWSLRLVWAVYHKKIIPNRGKDRIPDKIPALNYLQRALVRVVCYNESYKWMQTKCCLQIWKYKACLYQMYLYNSPLRNAELGFAVWTFPRPLMHLWI